MTEELERQLQAARQEYERCRREVEGQVPGSMQRLMAARVALQDLDVLKNRTPAVPASSESE